MFAVDISRNAKVGPVSATYAPRQTCSAGCPFKGHGCYADSGNCRMHNDRISQKALDSMTPAELAHLEASEINDLPGLLPLRLHVTGDARTSAAANILGRACQGYRRKYNQPAWTYTHAWRSVPRMAWGLSVSVLASCETVRDCVRAHDRGYAPALVTVNEEEEKTGLERAGLTGVLCLHAERGVPCTICRLCFDDFELHGKGHVILLPPHGSGAGKIRCAVEEKRKK